MVYRWVELVNSYFTQISISIQNLHWKLLYVYQEIYLKYEKALMFFVNIIFIVFFSYEYFFQNSILCIFVCFYISFTGKKRNAR